MRLKCSVLVWLAALVIWAQPASAQQIVCGGVRLPLAPGLPAVRDTVLKRVADSIPCIRTQNNPAMQLRNGLALRTDSLSRRVVRTDTLVIVRTDTLIVVDTVFVILPPDTVPEPPDSTPEIPPDPPTGEVWDSVLVGAHGDVLVPDGESWLIGANASVRCNLRTVSGRIAMRPGSNLRIREGDPARYIGGGMYYEDRFANDCGVWIGGANATGRLDIACTPKESWNRTGFASTWSATDELWVAPTEFGDFLPRRYTLGQPVPRASPLVPPAEVANVTRDCMVQGPGHIHIHSNAPQRVEYVSLQMMGVSSPVFGGPVTGRYALHFHMSAEGSRGSVVRGVACVDCRGTVFVPHASNGVTFTDNVVLNAWGHGFWWDLAQETADVLVDRLLVMGLEMPFEGSGISGGSWFDGLVLGAGTNMEVRNSVATGVRGGPGATGFDWPEPTPDFDPVLDKLVWTFNAGNVAHNNQGPGIRFWNNTADDHVVANYVSYRNQSGAIENGAYVNVNAYQNVTLFEEGWGNWYDAFTYPAIIWNSNPATTSSTDRAAIRNATITARNGAALVIGHRQLPAGTYMELTDVTLNAGPGQPKIFVTEGTHPWQAIFTRANVTPADIVFETLTGGNEGTHIIGDGWEIRIINGQKVVTTR